MIDDYIRINSTIDIDDFFHFTYDYIKEQDGYVKLSENEKDLCNIYLSTIQKYSKMVGKIYRDVCFDNFGIYDGNYIIRDFEGYQDADKEKILNSFLTVSLDDFKNNILKI